MWKTSVDTFDPNLNGDVVVKDGIQMTEAGTGVLPAVTDVDKGKVLTVSEEGVWEADDIPAELPAVTSEDAGKVLTVSDDGEWEARPDTFYITFDIDTDTSVTTCDTIYGDFGQAVSSGKYNNYVIITKYNHIIAYATPAELIWVTVFGIDTAMPALKTSKLCASVLLTDITYFSKSDNYYLALAIDQPMMEVLAPSISLCPIITIHGTIDTSEEECHIYTDDYSIDFINSMLQSVYNNIIQISLDLTIDSNTVNQIVFGTYNNGKVSTDLHYNNQMFNISCPISVDDFPKLYGDVHQYETNKYANV